MVLIIAFKKSFKNVILVFFLKLFGQEHNFEKWFENFVMNFFVRSFESHFIFRFLFGN